MQMKTVQGTGGAIRAPAGAREVRIRAEVIRADGRREQRGTVSYWHASRFWRAWFACKQRVCRLVGVQI